MTDAPLGLRWGMTDPELFALSLPRLAEFTDGQIRVVEVGRSPKQIAGTAKIQLVLDAGLGLQRIIWVGETHRDDSHGEQCRDRYKRLKAALTRKYGKPGAVTEVTGRVLYAAPDQFYESLAHEGCGRWACQWDLRNPRLGILLEIKGVFRGEGYVSLNFEGPEWSAVLSARDRTKDWADYDAL